MKHTRNTGFSIILAMGIVLLLSLIGLYLMEYMIPFSRNVKGIENASQAFYESYGGVEENVLSVYSGDAGLPYNKSFSGVQDYEYAFQGGGQIIPFPSQGNSQNSDFSRFSQTEPISLQIGNGRFNNSGETIDLFLEIPNGVGFDTPYTDEIILIQLSGAGGSITSASGSLITETDVNSASAIDILSEDGTTLQGANMDFEAYFTILGCGNLATDCVLKLSVIRPLISNSGDATIPYLEYKIEASKSVPYPNPLMISQGKSYGFSKTLEVFIPQRATSSAFDFTVLQ